jgi:hypothetical protein
MEDRRDTGVPAAASVFGDILCRVEKCHSYRLAVLLCHSSGAEAPPLSGPPQKPGRAVLMNECLSSPNQIRSDCEGPFRPHLPQL